MPEISVLNAKMRVTGVTTTAAATYRAMAARFSMTCVGKPLLGLDVAPISFFEAIRNLRRRPKDQPFVIWHARRNKEMIWSIIARDILRLPVRVVFTSSAQRRHSFWPRFLISRMDAVIATTDVAASYLRKVARIVPHGIDTALFHPAADRAAAWRALGFPGDYGMGIVGRIRAQKGTDLFVEIMIRALPRLPGATALVVGSAVGRHEALLRDLRERVRKAGLADRFVFTGDVSPTEMPGIMRALSLLVPVPTREEYGMTVLEAMASGTPFLATDTGHFRAFAGADVPLCILENRDAEAVAARVVALMEDSEGREALGQRLRARAVAHFPLEAEVEGIAAVYQSLLQTEPALSEATGNRAIPS